MAAELIRCRDGCGASVPDEQTAQARGWLWLPVARAYRCPACQRALQEPQK